MNRFSVKRGELLLVSTFAWPLFDLWSDLPNLFAILHSALVPYGFRATDLRWEQGGGATDAKLVFHLLAFRLTVKMRVDQIEVQSFDLPRLDATAASAAVSALFGALSEYRARSSVRAHTFSIGLHGELVDQPTQPFLASFVRNAPEGLGRLAGAGCVYYFEQEGTRVSLSVTLDASSAVTDGLFFRVVSIWDASATTPDRMRYIVSEQTAAVANTFGLAITNE